MPRSRMFLAVLAVSICGSLFFLTGIASAHNINLTQTRKEIQKYYVQRVLNDPHLPYVKARTHCRYKFKGHSHWAICTDTYATGKDADACQEKIEAYIQIYGGLGHPFARDGIFERHITKPCGRFRLISLVPPIT